MPTYAHQGHVTEQSFQFHVRTLLNIVVHRRVTDAFCCWTAIDELGSSGEPTRSWPFR